MGKGQIISGGTDGLYNVQIQYNNDRLDAMLADLAAKKTDLEENRAEVQTERDEKAVETDAAISELQVAVQDLADMYGQKQVWTEQLSDVTMDLEELKADLKDAQERQDTIYASLITIEEEHPDDYEEREDWNSLYNDWTVEDSNISSLENSIVAKEEEKADLTRSLRDLEKKIADQEALVKELEKPASDLAYELELLDQQLSALDLDIASIEKRISELENTAPEDETISAWCADLTEDLTGTVGTVEVPGEKQVVQIQPGYEGNAAYNQTRDGQLFPSVAMTPAQAYYNFAMLPGWQKWKPTFRYGIIDSISEGGLAAVTLDASMVSTAQDLEINQSATLSRVDFEYMSCDHAAFEAGDEVLVRFDNQLFANPMIVGFKEWPQPCELIVPYLRASADVSATEGYMVCMGDAVPLADFGSITSLYFDTAPHEVITPYGGAYPAPYEYSGQLLEWQIRNYTDGSGRLWDEIPWMSDADWDPYFYSKYENYWEEGDKPYRFDSRTTSLVRGGDYFPEFCEYEASSVFDISPGGDTLNTSFTKQWKEGTPVSEGGSGVTWSRYSNDVLGTRNGAIDQDDPGKYGVVYSLRDWEVNDTNLAVGCTINTTDQIISNRRVIFKGLGHTHIIETGASATSAVRLYKVQGKHVCVFFTRTTDVSGNQRHYLGTAVDGGSFTIKDVTSGMMVNDVMTDILTVQDGSIAYSAPGLLLMGGEYDRT